MARGNDAGEIDWRDRRLRSGRSHGAHEGPSNRHDRDVRMRAGRDGKGSSRRQRSREIPARRVRMRLADSNDEYDAGQIDQAEPPRNSLGGQRARNNGSAAWGRHNGDLPNQLMMEPVDNAMPQPPSESSVTSSEETPPKKKVKKANFFLS